MTLATEALERLAAVLTVLDRTAEMLEDESPGAAECGYWTRDEKTAVELAKALIQRVKSDPNRGKYTRH